MASQQWYAWVDLKERTKKAKRDHFWLGCAIETSAERGAELVPYLASSKQWNGKLGELLTNLRRQKVVRAEAIHEEGQVVITLARLPLPPGVDLEQSLAECRNVFELLATARDTDW